MYLKEHVSWKSTPKRAIIVKWLGIQMNRAGLKAGICWSADWMMRREWNNAMHSSTTRKGATFRMEYRKRDRFCDMVIQSVLIRLVVDGGLCLNYEK